MKKTISTITLTGLVLMSCQTFAGQARQPSNQELSQKVEELTRQLEEIKAQLAQQNESIVQNKDDIETIDDTMEEQAEAIDLASRFTFYGDFRTRLDYFNGNGATMLNFTNGQTYSNSYKNDNLITNRLRLNMRVKATENLEFKGRLAMYKVWGMESQAPSAMSQWPIFDGNSTRTPSDNALRVDRAYLNWNNIGGAPVWFSIGRRPTTDGPPAHLRMGQDKKMATPVAYMDYPFDGFVLGYAYTWGEDIGDGRIRFCYGRGFESGLENENTPSLKDTDFTGISWDVIKNGARFLNIQSFVALNMFNYPSFQDPFVNYGASMPPELGGYGPRRTEGDIYHTSAVYMDKINSINYFIAGGWSHTDPGAAGLFNDVIAMSQGLSGPNTSAEDGYSIYLGTRYDMDDIGLKLGLEYNYGSQYWIAFSPGHDDLYNSKLGTRGSVAEAYLIYDLPTGEAISKYAQTFIRLGYQHYWYDYTGVMDWNIKPYDIDNPMDMAILNQMGMPALESADQIYLSFEAYF